MAAEESRGTETEMQKKEGDVICLDSVASHDFASGIMKIVPDVDVSAD